MTVLIAPDKFKGSLTARQAAEAMRAGLLRHNPAWAVTLLPLADGGEGTADVLTQATGGQTITLPVCDPLGRSVTATYGLSGPGIDPPTAYIELAQASGLSLLRPSERDPLKTSTFGTGELIRDALNRGVRRLVLCIGGSATNDGGIGLATALGYRFLDADGVPVDPIGGNLNRLRRIDASGVLPQLADIDCVVACDVDNPLTGPAGAAAVYAPQKGADRSAVAALDAGLAQLASVVRADWGLDLADEPGSGAAGGTGYGARVFLNARLDSGFALVARTLQLADHVAAADLILTGEGSLDEQTLSGKVIGGLTGLARAHQKPVVAFCGRLRLTPAQLRDLGLRDATAITPAHLPFAEAVRQAPALLTDAVYSYLQRTRFA